MLLSPMYMGLVSSASCDTQCAKEADGENMGAKAA